MPVDTTVFDNSLQVPIIWWVGTLVWFLILIFGDMYINRRTKTEFSLKLSVIRSIIWVALGVLLGVVIWLNFGGEAGARYFAGFLIEKSLSADNIFVWGVILTFFAIPKKYHYRVLFYGIMGAIVFRTIFVFGGLTLIEYFNPALLVLGFGLVGLAYKLLRSDDGVAFDPSTSRIVKFVRKILPVTERPHDGSLFAKENGKTVVTMLFFTICVIELTDIVFAIDSVPAAIAVARDPYIVLASNIAAVLGLRALYFVYERLEDKFYLLNKALALILSVIGLTLVLEPKSIFGVNWVGLQIPAELSIGFVLIVLISAIVGSLLRPRRKTKPAQ
jgi:tellurite resistance protein TerC